jgi:hypothetical protein
MSETAVVPERNLEPESSKTTAGPGLVKAHSGIRGLVAFYIMLFHALAFSAGWNLHGSALMPVFFLLSGYSLAIVYGKQRPGFDVKHYYHNRFARIAPVYYAMLLIALPLAVFGHGWVSPSDIGIPRTRHSIRRLGRPTCSGLEFQHAHARRGNRCRAAREHPPRHAARTNH